MSTPQYRSHEPLYLVIVRSNDAESLLRAWAKAHQVQAHIETNRMKLYDHRSYTLFLMRWSGDWARTMIWDYWLKRHIIYPDDVDNDA